MQMKKIVFRTFLHKAFLLLIFFFLASFVNQNTGNIQIFQKNFSDKFPYSEAGISAAEASEHLLSRFTFGVRQQDIQQVLNMGLENWFAQQLEGNLEDNTIKEKLSAYKTLHFSNTQILELVPRGTILKKRALKEGYLSAKKLKNTEEKDLKKIYNEYREQKGLIDENVLTNEFISQKIIRATYSNNQLHEILTDFWFNHFNVSMTQNQCKQFVMTYERDAIRPFVVDNFEQMLLHTAKSPAMLIYLDNANSTGTNQEMQSFMASKMDKKKLKKYEKNKKQKTRGLNENYAREVMELHTLGVDGGYTQQDVTEAARVLTGWTLFPISDYDGFAKMRKTVDKIGEANLNAKGYTRDGDFLFAKNFHDDGVKKVLGKKYQHTGYQEGEDLLKYLAGHNSTARFIAKKLATRFVADNPPKSIVDKMAKTFLQTNGDIKQVLKTMVYSPEFWSKASRREKAKSPFEYAISSLRVLNANVESALQINNWITKMGQKMYYYQAPTGFPDKAQHWINTGSLLNRMNFGLALASKRIPGVSFSLAALNNHHEPESAEDALTKYSAIVMPERNLTSTINRLLPMVKDAQIASKINQAADKNQTPMSRNNDMVMEDKMEADNYKTKKKGKYQEAVSLDFGDNSQLAQVVGIIIGSPEFQRK